MIIVYRYIVNDTVVEKFWVFLKLKKQNSEVLAECIKEQLDQHIGNETNINCSDIRRRFSYEWK